jgi:hypothetical protein
MHIAKISLRNSAIATTIFDIRISVNHNTSQSSSHVTATRVGTRTTTPTFKMSYNKGEKDFGEGPKVHRIRITLTSRSMWQMAIQGIDGEAFAN